MNKQIRCSVARIVTERQFAQMVFNNAATSNHFEKRKKTENRHEIEMVQSKECETNKFM